MKIKPKILALIASAALAVIIPLIVFHSRSPVLIVTEESFIGLYGKDRLKKEAFRSSFALFRPIKTVTVVNDAGEDVVPFAVSVVSSKPFCVLFPLRFARSAKLYHEGNPQIRVVLLEGMFTESENPSASEVGGDISGYFVYKTDISADFYRAGRTAVAFDKGETGRFVVFLQPSFQIPAREAFQRALNDLENQRETLFFTSFSQYSDISDVSCVVLAGVGAEYLEKKTGVPVIFFTWLDPVFIPSDVVFSVNDSPWAQAVQAVKLVKSGKTTGLIRSNFQAIDRKKINRGFLP
ncbi:MAG: hypothetical protein LBI28_06590 [Treponema sp.]|jgi:hypothetical protein|nr:hypothetical protein [Treponema sp.]